MNKLTHSLLITRQNLVIHRTQHGFVKNKSYQTNLLYFFCWVASLLDGGCAVDVIYIDFAKALDKVPHDILISKFIKYGLDDTSGGFITGWMAA